MWFRMPWRAPLFAGLPQFLLLQIPACSWGLTPNLEPLSPDEQSAAIDWVVEAVLAIVEQYRRSRSNTALSSLAAKAQESGGRVLWQRWQGLAGNLAMWASGTGSEGDICLELPALRDDLALMGATAGAEPFEGSFGVLRLIAEALGLAECCRSALREWLRPALATLVEKEDVPWRFMDEWRELWGCMEWAFWGKDGGDGWTGIKGKLWEAVLMSNHVLLYGVTEPLTVQLAFMPLCAQPTLWHNRLRLEKFEHQNDWDWCVERALMNAGDHLLLAGRRARAEEMRTFVREFRSPASNGGSARLLYWRTFHNMGASVFPRLTAWPWWQLHPGVARVVDFLEENFDLIASERHKVENHPELERDAYPFSGSSDKSWRALHFVQHDKWLEDRCALAPQTCEAFRQQGFLAAGLDACGSRRSGVNERLMWSVVDPHAMIATHSGEAVRINIQMCVHGCDGAKLYLNGTTVPYHRGKVIAFQDSFRHTIVNRGDTPRWVFQITVTHPDLGRAWHEECGHWPSAHRRLGVLRQASLARLSRATSPYSRVLYSGGAPRVDVIADVGTGGEPSEAAASSSPEKDCFVDFESFERFCCSQKLLYMGDRREWRSCCSHLVRSCPLPTVVGTKGL
mmetsp:Transcript_68729/g.201224  ORF Transcript_68729/g.201224 Transcript_68729/m.201224 type:complete len:625 (-) Transcript_68729:81-1955(-)